MSVSPRRRFLARWVPFLLLLLLAMGLTQRLAGRHDARIDLTDARLHTLSPELRSLLARIDDRVTITYYSSERVPSGFQNLRDDTIDVLSEIERASGGRVLLQVVDPYDWIEERVEERRRRFEAGEDEDPLARAIEPEGGFPSSEEELRRQRWTLAEKEALSREGVVEIRGPSVGEGSVGFVFFYSAIEVRYLDRPTELIPAHSSLIGLEYELASRIARLIRVDRPKIALLLGRPEDRLEIPANPQTGQGPRVVHVFEALQQALEREFRVEVIDLLDDGSRIPEDAKLLIVAEPYQLERRQLYEIDRSIVRGRPALFLVSTVSGDLRRHRGPFETLEPGLDPLLEKWGVSISRELISSFEAGRIDIVRTGADGRPSLVQEEYPLAPRISGSGLSADSPLTQGLTDLVFPFASAFRPNPLVLERAGVSFTPLATTDEISWNSAFRPQLTDGMQRPPMETSRRQRFVVAALLEGAFPTAFPPGDPIPRWRSESVAEDGNLVELPPPRLVEAVDTAPGRVLLLGSSDMAKVVPLQVLRGSQNFPFLAGIVESLTLGQDLVNIRAKRPVPRPLAETTARERWWATWVNIVGVPAAILAAALLRFGLRRAGARAYELAFDREGGEGC